MSRKVLVGALVLINVIVVVGYLNRKPDPRVIVDDKVDTSVTYSNILPKDYVGPDTCAGCHQTRHDQWATHSHSKMNQLPTPQSVVGNFEDQTLQLDPGSVHFTHEGSRYLMSVSRAGQPLRSYEVTRTVGSRYMQFYIGKQLTGPEPKDSPLYEEHMLPFCYWIDLHRWLPKAFFDADGAEVLKAGVPEVEGIDKITDIRPYNQECMNCHNTYAYSYRIFKPIFAGFPSANVAAALGPLSEALAADVKVDPQVHSFETVSARLSPDKNLVTIGISCESCHLGGREHALNGKPIRFAPTSPLVKLTAYNPKRPVTGDRHDPASINGICAQCHSGNSPLYPSGAAHANSSEAYDFLSGACASKLSCVGCHDPHIAGQAEDAPATAKQAGSCVGCHKQYEAPAQAAAHSKHGDAVSCLDCHMPRQTLGLNEVVRTHRIAVPVEQSMVDKASLNACNLCHLDKPLRWTVAELAKGWNKQLSTAQVDPGSLDQPLGELWLKSPEQSVRLVATQSYARSPLGKDRLRDLILSLNDPEPINRVFAVKAINRVTGKTMAPEAYSLTAAPAARKQQLDQLLVALQGRYGP